MKRINKWSVEAPQRWVRRLRELAEQRTYGAIARKLGFDRSAVRKWADASRAPTSDARERFFVVYGWPTTVWDEQPQSCLAPTVLTLAPLSPAQCG